MKAFDIRIAAVDGAFRTAYADLIAALDATFLHRRTGGAERLGPMAKLWKEDEKTLIGDYTLWLGNDPQSPHTWLVMHAGIHPRTDADGQPLQPMTPYNFGRFTTGSLDHLGLRHDQPVLLLPRPSREPVTFTARVTSGSVPSPSTIHSNDAAVIGSTHQWSARDPQALANNVQRDIDLLFPGVLLP
ncbi:hypothetical protein ACFV6F_33610 [Kitasatospora phosalacinea]|uniref:hypothetical protein n=1 Tax=Kitasatospora phosalacinea TaxID=2065 RepID=UPI003669D708